jgi:hypothetical protein
MKTSRTGILILLVLLAGLFFLLISLNNPAINSASPAVTDTVIKQPANAADAQQTSLLSNPATAQITRAQQRYQAIASEQYPDMETRQDALHQHHPNLQIDADELVDLLSEPTAWRNLSQVPEHLPLTTEEKNDGREFIEIDTKRWAVLLPGDEVELPVNRTGVRYTVIIDGIEKQPNDTITWHGHLKNIDGPMLVSLTQGEGISLGGFDTPNGHYVIQVNGNQGWVASSATLFKPNPNHPTDIVIPPVDDHQHP